MNQGPLVVCSFFNTHPFLGCHASSDQTANVFVERALTYVLGYLLQAEGGGAARKRL